MTRDIEVLEMIIVIDVVIAAFFTTAFPILYLFSEWNKSKLGKILMLQGVAFALAVDLTLLFAFWTPKDILVQFWVSAFVFTFIAFATGALCWMLWRTNHGKCQLRRSKQKE